MLNACFFRFDHNYCLFDSGSSERSPSGLLQAAKVTDPSSGRVMSVYTDQPGVQFYTGKSKVAYYFLSNNDLDI